MGLWRATNSPLQALPRCFLYLTPKGGQVVPGLLATFIPWQFDMVWWKNFGVGLEPDDVMSRDIWVGTPTALGRAICRSLYRTFFVDVIEWNGWQNRVLRHRNSVRRYFPCRQGPSLAVGALKCTSAHVTLRKFAEAQIDRAPIMLERSQFS